MYEKCLQVSSSVKGKPLPTPLRGREWATLYAANVGGDRRNPGIRIPPLPCANGLGKINRNLRIQWRKHSFYFVCWTVLLNCMVPLLYRKVFFEHSMAVPVTYCYWRQDRIQPTPRKLSLCSEILKAVGLHSILPTNYMIWTPMIVNRSISLNFN